MKILSRLFLTVALLFSLHPVFADALRVSTTALPTAQSGKSYNASLSAKGGPAPFSWHVEKGVLPSGLALSNQGQISGTPTGSATTSDFTVTVIDAHGATSSAVFHLVVNAPPPPAPVVTAISPTSAGPNDGATLTITGQNFGTNPQVFIAGVLASPVNTSPNTSSMLSVTVPNMPSNVTTCSQIDVKVVNPDGQQSTLSGAFDYVQSIVISNVVTASINGVTSTVTTTKNDAGALVLPQGNVGQSYSVQFSATGGCGPLTWSISSGSLPPGIILAKNGTITIPAEFSGTFSFAGLKLFKPASATK